MGLGVMDFAEIKVVHRFVTINEYIFQFINFLLQRHNYRQDPKKINVCIKNVLRLS